MKQQSGHYIVLSVEVLPNQQRNFSPYQAVLPNLHHAISHGDNTAIKTGLNELNKAETTARCISYKKSILNHYTPPKQLDPNTFELVIELKQAVSTRSSATELLTNGSLAIKSVALNSQQPTPAKKPVVHTALSPSQAVDVSAAAELKNAELQRFTARITSWLKTIDELQVHSHVLLPQARKALLGFREEIGDFASHPGYNLESAEKLLKKVVNFCYAVHDQIEHRQEHIKLDQAIAAQANWLEAHLPTAQDKQLSSQQLAKCNNLTKQARASSHLSVQVKQQLVNELVNFNRQVYPLLNATHPSQATVTQSSTHHIVTSLKAVPQSSLTTQKEQLAAGENPPVKVGFLRGIWSAFTNWVQGLFASPLPEVEAISKSQSTKQTLEQSLHTGRAGTKHAHYGSMYRSKAQLTVVSDASVVPGASINGPC